MRHMLGSVVTAYSTRLLRLQLWTRNASVSLIVSPATLPSDQTCRSGQVSISGSNNHMSPSRCIHCRQQDDLLANYLHWRTPYASALAIGRHTIDDFLSSEYGRSYRERTACQHAITSSRADPRPSEDGTARLPPSMVNRPEGQLRPAPSRPPSIGADVPPAGHRDRTAAPFPDVPQRPPQRDAEGNGIRSRASPASLVNNSSRRPANPRSGSSSSSSSSSNSSLSLDILP